MDLELAFNVIVGVIGTVLGILGVVLTIRSTRKKDPAVYFSTYKDIVRLSPEQNSHIHIFYKKQEVDRIFTTYIWFWNKGKIPIIKSDLQPKPYILLNFSDDDFPIQILDHRLIKTSRDAIGFKAEPEGTKSLRISFDFLDQEDGGVIEVQHTGSLNTSVQTDGVILEVPSGVKTIQRVKRRKLADTNNPLIRFMRSIVSNRESEGKPTRFVRANMWVAFVKELFPVIFILIYFGCFGTYAIRSISEPSPIEAKIRFAIQEEIPGTGDQVIQRIIDKSVTRLGPITTPFFAVVATLLLLILLYSMASAYKKYHSRTPYPPRLDFDLQQVKREPEQHVNLQPVDETSNSPEAKPS
ncbi:MAG: hypothetical protein HGB26_07765 [Desulfobulbaceae bacterium]|nr:hypothetical protein [Desulfobulbaceae bacterium]